MCNWASERWRRRRRDDQWPNLYHPCGKFTKLEVEEGTLNMPEKEEWIDKLAETVHEKKTEIEDGFQTKKLTSLILNSADEYIRRKENVFERVQDSIVFEWVGYPPLPNL